MSNKYLGHTGGLIGPVDDKFLTPPKDSEYSFYKEKSEYYKHLAALSANPIPCEGWVPEEGVEYVKGVDFKILRKADKVSFENDKEVVTAGERFAVLISHTDGVVVLLPIPVKEAFDTIANCWVYSNEQYNISGYGKTRIEAYEMFQDLAREALVYKPQSESPVPLPAAAPVQTETKTDKDEAQFIEKHMKIIKDKMKDAFIHEAISPLFDGLESASVKYFLETGTINGGFKQRLLSLVNTVIEWQKNWKKEAAPAYPADFVEWCVKYAVYQGGGMWKFGHRLYETTAELYAGPYQEYLKSQSK